jgi:glucan phosphoethanolaminetransferase (alkaline phosphatase superfamily)
MIRGLKIAMIVWAVIGIVMGIAFIFFPTQLRDTMGYETGPAYIQYFLALLGVAFIALGAFIIRAAQDPLKHIMWVQFAIAWAVLFVVVEASSIARGLVTFEQAGMALIMDAVFAVLFLVFYPWRAKPSS